MKTVVIARNGKELARVPLNRKNLLAGRSPSCDAVIRYQGVKPVQFFIEHISENMDQNSTEVDFDKGFWTVIDISENNASEAEKRNLSGGAGIALDVQAQNFQGFDFKIVIDTLQETDLKKGVISRSLDHNSVDNGLFDRDVVEVIYFRKDLDIVTNISHLHKKKTSKKIKLFKRTLPDFIFEWENQGDVKATLKSKNIFDKVEIFKRGERITQNFIDTQKVDIAKDDVIHIETENDDFYIRLVPEIEVVLDRFSWTRDFMIRITIAILAMMSLLVVVVKTFVPPAEPKPEPPRVIKIEIPEKEKPAEPPPKPEPPKPEPEPVVEKKVEPPPPPPPKPKPTPKPADNPKSGGNPQPVAKKPEKKQPDLEVSNNQTKQKMKASDTTVVNRPTEKSKVGLNNNSQPKNVNSIGLLAKLKNGQTATKQKVSADAILNQGVVSETMTGEKGQVVVTKPPAGTLGRQKEPIDNNALAEASTTLSGATVANPKASGSLAMKGGNSRFSSGTQLNGMEGAGGGGTGRNAGSGGNGGGSGAGSGNGFGSGSGSGFDRGDSMEALGGLDKEAIRKALRENRRAIANCYETALLTKKELSGRMTFKWVITPLGQVSTIKLQSSELDMPNFESCVETVIRSIRFPQAPNKQPTTVIYPFAFQGKK